MQVKDLVSGLLTEHQNADVLLISSDVNGIVGIAVMETDGSKTIKSLICVPRSYEEMAEDVPLEAAGLRRPDSP